MRQSYKRSDLGKGTRGKYYEAYKKSHGQKPDAAEQKQGSTTSVIGHEANRQRR